MHLESNTINLLPESSSIPRPIPTLYRFIRPFRIHPASQTNKDRPLKATDPLPKTPLRLKNEPHAQNKKR